MSILFGVSGLIVGFVAGFLVYRNNVNRMKEVEVTLRKVETKLKEEIAELKEKNANK